MNKSDLAAYRVIQRRPTKSDYRGLTIYGIGPSSSGGTTVGEALNILEQATDPNRIQGGKRPRSSIAPTIVLRHGEPVLAVGSPGGSTIITTVLQTLVNRIDRGMTLPEAVAAPRASNRNMDTKTITAEPAFIDAYGPQMTNCGYTLTKSGDNLTSAADIGAVVALEFDWSGRVQAVAEPKRRGGGDAGVVFPR